MEDVVVIGSGPAGYTAAIYCARAGRAPVVIEGYQPGGQLTATTDIENYPGFKNPVNGPRLMLTMREQAERFGARFRSGAVVFASLKSDPKMLTLDDDTTLETRTVIIATGAAARYLGIESEQRFMGRGVSGCATCDGAFFRNRRVAVVGGGDTAMEEALYLARLCEKVVVIHRRDEFRASRFMVGRAMNEPKIEIAWNSVVEEVLGSDDEGVTGLRLKNVKTEALSTLDVAAMFVAIGHTPNSEPFARELTCDAKGYIQTRPGSTRTAIAGVFAAGDVQDAVYRQAVTAAGSGCMAAIEVDRYFAGHRET